MNLELTEEQTMLCDAAQKYLRVAYGFDARNQIVSSASGMSREHWQRFGEFGWLGLGLPEAHGGFGGVVELIQVAEAMGAALVVEPYLASTVLGAQALTRAGSPAQQAAWLPGLASGQRILTLAHGEVDARYELAYVTTRASARDGSRAGDLLLEQVLLGQDALLGAEGQGLALLEQLIDLGIVVACADALGAMGALLRKTVEYASTRKQFDVPIASFQVIQHRLVDMFAAVEASRSLLLMAALHADHSDATARSRAVSAAKSAIGERARCVAQQAVQLHGGVGMTEELDIGHYFRRLTLFCQLFGSSDHHLQRFAALPELVESVQKPVGAALWPAPVL